MPPAQPGHRGRSGSSTDPRRFFIQLDDDDDDDVEEEEDGEFPPLKQARRAAPSLVSSSSPGRAAASLPPLSASASPDPLRAASPGSIPLILDDDDDDDDEHEKAEEQRHRQQQTAEAARTKAAEGQQSGRSGSRSARLRSSQRLSIQLPSASDSSQVNSPLKPTVKDLFFPNRLDPEVRPCSPLYESIHAYQQHYQQQQQQQLNGGVSDRVGGALQAEKNTVAAPAQPLTAAARKTSSAVQRHAPPPKRGRAQSRGAAAAAAAAAPPALPDWGRPADTLLRDFFPSSFTRKNFMAAAQTVMSPMHFLEAGDFWDAFASAEFVGEGSFGLVWRCRTVDGDLVAVKSCPLILRTKANIEDSFSTIREIATMRFLNEMQVPYILPLHSAFFVKAAEALPPLAQDALEWRQQLRRRAETVVLEREVALLGKGRAALSKRSRTAGNGGMQAKRAASSRGGEEGDAPLTFEEQVAQEMQRQARAETRAEKQRRTRLQDVRLPRFLSITEEDLHQSDATAFLVMELCDGDVEGIPRSEGVAKGVAYCVSSALAAMHELGLLHLDLKPSNVLFAYEHGPSQASSPLSVGNGGGGGGGGAGEGMSGPAVDAVKFYLSDFGNCRLVGPGPLAEVAEAYGTYEYMDLPALQDAVCGRPTDAFSLGATLFELLYGKRLYPRCANPKCAEEADHTRACFVEAARRPVALPPLLPSPVGGGEGGARSSGSMTMSLGGTSRAAASATAAAAAAASGPLQVLIAALLKKQWKARMTAVECRRYLIDAFHITQAEEGETANEAESMAEEDMPQ